MLNLKPSLDICSRKPVEDEKSLNAQPFIRPDEHLQCGIVKEGERGRTLPTKHVEEHFAIYVSLETFPIPNCEEVVTSQQNPLVRSLSPVLGGSVYGVAAVVGERR